VRVTVKILLDTAGMARLLFIKGTGKLSGKRAYFTAAAPARVVVVFYGGLGAMHLIRHVVEAKVTTAAAPAGTARPGNAGKQHTIISVLRKADNLADHVLVLSRVIEEGRQDEPEQQ
jgi:hypothetical protein